MNAMLAIIAAVVAAVALSFLEWRQPDRRHLVARLGATWLAVGALALLGWRPTWRQTAPGGAASQVEASLWTPGASAGEGSDGTAARDRFALPGVSAAPADATVLPDAAILRRRFPEIGTLHVHGDGLEPFDLAALRGLRIVFHPAPDRPTAPMFDFVRCPRELPSGEPLVVQGRLSGLPPGQTAAFILEAPDGNTTDAVSFPADDAGEAGFSVQAAPPPAPGRFVWRLRLGKNDEPLGVSVAPPDLPRVLVLAGVPRFDTAALRRWFERAGGTLTARTLVGQDRYRFESAHDPPLQFAALDATLLAGYDLVLADGRALAALPPPERDALRGAVVENGLGVLVLADDAVLPGATGIAPEVRETFFPWRLPAVNEAAGEGDWLARVEWPGQAQAAEIPVPCAPCEIAPQAGQTPLMHDGQGHTLAASVARGRGQIGLTLVRETGRWTRENDPAAFAAYWSVLFSALARKMDAGHWTLAGGDAGVVFVDQPVELVWSGPPKTTPGPGWVTASADGEQAEKISLALAPDPDEPGRWRGKFWPRRSGWHRVGLADTAGKPLDFFVQANGNWTALAAARRRAATGRFAVESTDAAVPGATATPAPGTADSPGSTGGWFALFLAGAGYLWVERRRAG